MEEYYSVLLDSALFNGIQPKRYKDVLGCLNAKKVHYKSGVMFAEIGKESKLTGIVLNGTIEENVYDEAGNQVNICRFNSGKVFGAELVCTSFNNSQVTLETKSECDAKYGKPISIL